MNALHHALETLLAERDVAYHLSRDPVRFARRYRDPGDQEVAGFIASAFAFGRVAAFGPKLDHILDHADRHGGPRQWVVETAHDVETWRGFQYRWIHAGDLVGVLLALQLALENHGSIGALVRPTPDEPHLAPALGRAWAVLRESIPLPITRGMRHLLADAGGTSAAKRVHLYARWMVRPEDGVDLGVWRHLQPSRLLMPVDTHVHRIARLVGLTDRKQPDRRAAEQVTDALKRFDPADPVRFDFALAHLGISDGCRGERIDTVCAGCALRPVCLVGGR